MIPVLKSLEDTIWEHVADALKEKGYNIVRVKLFSSKEEATQLQIMVEKTESDASVSLDECADLHHFLLVLLQVENLIKKEYRLEVSSAGVERPLVKYEDFTQKRFLDKKICVALYHPMAESKDKKITGFLIKAENYRVYMMQKIGKTEKIWDIDFYNIAQAHIVFAVPKKK